MSELDWLVVVIYALGMVAIGFWSYRRVVSASDFFAAGGKMPWWLAGISHHMSGYSAAVFVAYAGVAYTYGFALYVWWALPISVAILVGSAVVVPRWARLRIHYRISSPLEYLRMRYNLPTQQALAWTGVLLKAFDMGAKWASIAIILQVFTGVPILPGILVSVAVSIFYIVLGGLWAAAATELVQFGIQFVAGIAMLWAVLERLGGAGAITGMWQRLPPGHAAPFHGQFTAGLAMSYLLVSFLSYNGGTWNLAQRYIASPTGPDARKAAYLSASLYLLWPLVLFFPMWAAPLILPNLADPTQSYSMLAKTLLPHGLVGLLLASLFAHTMAMTTSDANTVAAVISRDILPVLSPRFVAQTPVAALRTARWTTIAFTMVTVAIAVNAAQLGGVLDMLVLWFGALIGPAAVPIIFGLMPAFQRSGAAAAIVSWAGGFAVYMVARLVFHTGMTATVASPVLVSASVFILMGWTRRGLAPAEVRGLMEALSTDGPVDVLHAVPTGSR
jgi:SSS family solute:Na+ symporter